jgi:uncharacterized caspase-like protein
VPLTGLAATAWLVSAGCSQQGAPSIDHPAIARSPAGTEGGAELGRRLAAADFQIVDCRLPPRIRRVGGRVYLEPQRPARTTGRDCGIRGGDAVVFDPSNYATALALWLPLAEQGDPQAQTYVGDIYERGLTGSPDYEKAAEWYHRAADQGYASAQVSLGQLYERGAGVPEDRTQAMNLYRQASGLPEPLEIVAAAELEALRAGAGARDQEVQELTAEVERLRQELGAAQAEQRTLEAEQASLERSREQLLEQQAALEAAETDRGAATIARAEDIQQQLERLKLREDELAQREQDLAAQEAELRRKEEVLASASEPQGDAAASISPSEFGTYHALVIGNDQYSAGLTSLESAAFDAQAVAAILENQYGYNVFHIPNADRSQVLEALNFYKQALTPRDNLLIYYAGHGWLDEENERGYWLPVDAQPFPNTTSWISTVDVTDIVNSMQAKHVMIIADSCYAGALTDARPALVELPHLLDRMPVDYLDWLRLMANQPARLAMTSGSLEPVPDGTEGNHSVFAGALLESLGTNDDILAATRLFIKVAAQVSEAARKLGRSQQPTYRLIKASRYEGGDFFFVPAAGPSS